MTKTKVRAAAPADDFEMPEAWRQRPWVPVAIVAVMVALVLGAGYAVSQVLKPTVPASLSKCLTTSPQIGPHLFAGLQPMCIDTKKNYQATVVTTAGTFVITLSPKTAPVTVNNFVVLALNGFYDGLTFWRVESWVVQTGDPGGDGRGGPGYTLPEEPSATSWVPNSVGMARPPGGPINGSQFFIETQQWPAGPPTQNYNQFGTVATGLDKVQTLTPTDRVISISIKVS